MAFPEKTLQSEVVYDGPIFRIRKDKVTVVGGKTSYRDILEHNGGADSGGKRRRQNSHGAAVPKGVGAGGAGTSGGKD